MSASWPRFLGLMVFSSWLAAGCTSPMKIDAGGTCILNSDCNQGLVCTWGKCHVVCNASADCPSGGSCVTSSDQSNVCQLSGETYCIYNHDCPAGLICGVDQKCRKQCQVDVDCPYGEVCTSEQICVDLNNNPVVPDGGVSGTGGASGTGGTGGSASPTPDASSDLLADAPGGGGGTAATGGTTATGGTSTDAQNPDARNTDVSNPDVPVANIDAGPAPVIVISLGLAAPFAIAATAGVTNTITAPITHINGNVVLDPNPTCNAVAVDNAGGFGLCGGMPPTISGTVITSSYPDTTTATAVKAALNAAFLSITPLAGPPAVGTLGGGTPIAAPTTMGNVAGSPLVLGDNWFTPGVYTSTTSILITGDVTLDGQGDPNAVFIFQSASSLTTADGASSPGAHTRILLTHGAKASNVWWQVAGSATIGLYSEFQGNILAAFDVTMKTGAAACGRSMAGAWVGGSGAFIFDSNVVSVPGNGCPL